jgi:hypothetical protein
VEKLPARFGRTFWFGLATGMALCASLAASFFAGRWTAKDASPLELKSAAQGIPNSRIHPDLPVEWLQATATHGTTNMAGWVYYPRMQAFGGLFATNVIQYLGPSGKNAEYLLVSGASASSPSGGQVRASQSLIYVVDVKLGTFVAFAIPWNRTMESSGVAQMNTLLPVGGDAIRPMVGPGQRKAPALDPNQKANQANPNQPNQQNPNQQNPNQQNPNQQNPNQANQNNQANPNQAPNNQNRKQP